LTPTFGVGLALTELALLPPALLEGERQSCVIWYESFRQSPNEALAHIDARSNRVAVGQVMFTASLWSV